MLKPGDVVEGKYRIVRELGHGGMGAVYEGENVRIHRKVAIKVLHANVAEKADVVQRFEREAQAAGRIGSEHIVEVLDLGTLASGERFMVMEYLDGESLGDRIKRKKQLTPNELAPLVVQLLEGLHAAHAAGIVHRDLKPDNVYVLHSRGGQRDFVKILDFGVSKFSALDSDMSMTRTGAVMGTPYYMSPEQARGAKIDARSDLYSVGVIMYQAVTGRVPFRAETFNELVFKIALENADPPEQVVPGLDPGFAQLIQRTMTREADKRVQSAKELQQALQQWMAGAPAAAFAPAVGAVPGMHPGMVQSHAHLQQSAAGAMGASGLNTSGLSASGLNALGASGLGASGAMGASSPGLGQSGGQSSPGLGASGAPLQLTGSQPGLAMTSGPPKKGNGAVVAVVLAVAVLAGAGLGAYLFFLNKKGGEGASAAAADTSKPAATAAETAAAGAATAAPVASAAPSSEPTAVASSEPSTAPSVEPSAAPTAGPQPLAVGPRTGPAPKPTAKASTSPVAAPTSAPPPKPTATGRTVPGEL